MAGWVAPPVEPATMPAAVAKAAEPTATSTATPTVVCDSTVSVLSAWGSEDDPPSFQGIAATFAEGAEKTGTVTGPVAFATALAAGDTFESQVNQNTIGFYTGHGSPTDFKMLDGTPVVIKNLPPLGQFGQCTDPDPARLRYLILSSCQTFAHGPRACATPRAKDYGCPGEWRYDNPNMASVYTQWGSALGNGLHMACGSSTLLPPTNASQFWSKYGPGRSVADAILESLSNTDDVGLCLAKGGREFARSPLMADQTFTPAANPFDQSDPQNIYYHIQYTKSFTDTHRPGYDVLVDNIQAEEGPGFAVRVDNIQEEEVAAQFSAISEAFPSCLPVLDADKGQTQSRSGAPQAQELTRYSTEADALAPANSPSEEEFVDYARRAACFPLASGSRLTNLRTITETVECQVPGLRPQFASGIHMLLATFPAVPELQHQEALSVTQKNVIITFSQLIRLDEVKGFEELKLQEELNSLVKFYTKLSEAYPQMYPQNGLTETLKTDGKVWPLVRMLDGGLDVQLNVDGSPISVVNRWHPVKGTKGAERVRKPDEAFLRSLWELYYREAYSSTTGMDAPKDVSAADIVKKLLDDDKTRAPADILEILKATYKERQPPYRLASWTWGYDGTGLLRVGYQFRFDPNTKAGYTAADYPPVEVGIDGQTGDSCQGGAVPVPRNTVCVTGYAINHSEIVVDGTKFTPPLRVEAVPAGGSPSYFADVDSNGFFKFENLPVGDYNFRMQLPPGWDGLVPTTARGGVAETGITTLEKQSDCYHIVFKIRRFFDLTVIKWEELHNATVQPSMDWEITASPVGDKFVKAQTKTTNSGGQAQFALTPGKWLISEKVKAGWIPVTPRQVTIDLDQYAPPGAIGPLIFKNREPACYGKIIVQKRGFGTDANGNDIQLGPLAGWRVSVQRADNTYPPITKVTDGMGQATFAGLPPGVYSVSEQMQAGWEAVSDNPQTVIHRDCEETQVEFKNKELTDDLRIDGYKWFRAWEKPLKGSPMVGLSSWVITATLVGTDVYTTTITNGLGYYVFPADSLKAAGMAFPGATIEVCEEARENWIAKTPACVRVKFPYPVPASYTGARVDFTNYQDPPIGATNVAPPTTTEVAGW